MPAADLTTPPAARPAPAFAQFPTAWRFALRNQTRNRLAGLLLVLFVPAWYLLMAALAGHQPLSFRLFATGQVLAVDARDLTLISRLAFSRVGRYCVAHAQCAVMAVPAPALARELGHGRLGRIFWRRSLTPERVLGDRGRAAT